uniref:Immunoglobulin V-set domain-containing protein n=1 Tax=Oncorhynchus tshawytscha TaxID=74940 RepID=A0AAZ3RWT4_ONCTS
MSCVKQLSSYLHPQYDRKTLPSAALSLSDLFKWSNYGIHSLQSAPEKARTNSQPLQQRYTFTRYGMNCIHQPTGKPLEWMGWINTNTGAAGYTKSLEGRIELIKDNSVSMTRLKLSGLKSEDSAVYYWVQ